MAETVNLRRCVLNITARCTLKCKLCVMGAPYFQDPPHYSLETISKTIDRLFQVVDHVQWLEFSGGEPFVHGDLAEMIEKAVTYSTHFEKLQILTNGTLLPQDRLYQAMIKHREKIMVMISHYGELSRHADALEQLLKDGGIEVDVKKYYGEDQHFGGWVDYGGFQKRGKTQQELEQVFARCGATKMEGCFTTHGGQMHWCVPSARGMKLLKEIPDCPEDYIDLFDETLTVAQQREKILLLSKKKFITACDYCSGDHGTQDSSKRHKAAEQLS